jgi:hypothetical protein
MEKTTANHTITNASWRPISCLNIKEQKTHSRAFETMNTMAVSCTSLLNIFIVLVRVERRQYLAHNIPWVVFGKVCSHRVTQRRVAQAGKLRKANLLVQQDLVLLAECLLTFCRPLEVSLLVPDDSVVLLVAMVQAKIFQSLIIFFIQARELLNQTGEVSDGQDVRHIGSFGQHLVKRTECQQLFISNSSHDYIYCANIINEFYFLVYLTAFDATLFLPTQPQAFLDNALAHGGFLHFFIPEDLAQ